MRTLAVLLLLPLLLTGCGEPDRPSIPLFLALQRGDIDQLERHIYWGSDIQALMPDGQRPLQMAAAKGNVVVVRLLLKHGAAVDATDRDGRTAIQTAVLAGRTQVTDVLLKHGARLDADQLLLQAAREGNPDRDVVSYLVKRGANTEVRDPDGDTPLLLAVRGGHLRTARHLVDQGADVNALDHEGRSALRLAETHAQPEMAALLRRYGALLVPGQ
jgi:ankyrin repeat protein